MKHLVFILLILSSFLLEGQQDTTEYVVVSDVIIEGNNVTQPSIILRELTFSPGDTIFATKLEEELRVSKENIQNTTLFNFVDIECLRNNNSTNDVLVLIELTERWYLWPYPYVAYADRNVNAWYDADNLERFSYGAELKYKNFLGLKHNLNATLIAGYNQNYALSYDIPYLTKKQRFGLEFGIGYKRDKEVAYKTENNRVLYFNGDDEFARQSAFVFLEPYCRFGHRNRLFVNISYNNTLYHDTLCFLNADFANEDGSRFQYIAVNVTFKNDHRDEQNYPLNGHYFEVLLEKDGFGLLETSPDLFFGKITADWYQPIKGRWYWASNVTMKMSDNDDVPYFFGQGLGYKNDYVRTYELYVVDAMNFALMKNNLKFAILNPTTKYLPLIKNERFAKIHFALYANLFFDCAYSWKMSPNPTSFLDEKFIFGTGVGVDFVTYYDKVLRVEYGINDLGETGLFIHFVAPI